MTCAEARDRLPLYVDGELDAAASAEVERHLETCANCAREVEQLRALGASIRAEVEYHRAPDLLRERVRHAIEGSAAPIARPPRRRIPVLRWASVAASVAVVVAAFGAVHTWRMRDAQTRLAAQAVDAHVRSLMADHLMDVASTDQHTVKPWFNGRLDFSPAVLDLATAGYPLTGGRLDYLHGRPVAALVYMRRKHVINVFQWPVSGAGDRAPKPVTTEQGYHVIMGAHAGMAYWIVSDLNADELTAFARMLMRPSPTPSSGATPGRG